MDAEMKGLRGMLGDAEAFSRAGGKVLRAYQREVADAVIDSVIKRRGLSFAVMFPRQSGKNELQAQIEAYLLLLYHTREVEIVKISPTWRPQAITAMRRLERVLCFHPLAREIGWSKENGYSYRVDRARISFFSGEPTANIVGATASLLLEVDEAQNVDIEKYDTQIAPMAASTDATRVFWGTAWTADTLLARELRAAKAPRPPTGCGAPSAGKRRRSGASCPPTPALWPGRWRSWGASIRPCARSIFRKRSTRAAGCFRQSGSYMRRASTPGWKRRGRVRAMFF